MKLSIEKTVYAIVIVVVLFYLMADLIPEMQTAGNELNDTGAPLAGLFGSSGVVILLVMAGILIAVVKGFLPKK